MVANECLLPGVASCIFTFDPIGLTLCGGQVWNESLALAVPAGLLAFPGQGAAGPGEFVAVVKDTDWALDLVDEAAAW